MSFVAKRNPSMSQVFFDALALPKTDVNLEIGSGSHAQQTALIMPRCAPVALDDKPAGVVVPGDVNSTVACAWVAGKLGVKECSGSEVRTVEARLALPVSVEQVAVVIKQMSQSDRERLLDLVPELRQMTLDPVHHREDRGLAVVERMRREVSHALGGQLLSLSEPFLGDLTLGQYLALPDEERGRLWDAWAEIKTEELEELDVHPETMPAR